MQPSLANKKSIGIPELIYNSIMKVAGSLRTMRIFVITQLSQNLFSPPQCDKNVRAELLANITLSGGNTKFSGMEKRIYQVK